VSKLNATEAARSFSDVLNRVAAGEEVEVVRNGASVAVISAPKTKLMAAGQFRELIASAPRPDARFADDVRAARAAIGPPEGEWPS